ncbi:unnamed protein product [Parnassius apollo]|uniref:(apollo) hypothetical protein n=1 Tax=Parnassius apollo TaxID=110799 RepID=A0A8S3W6W6_PARAO|nr:unnamed protein product [Parnassius apollo]
MAEIIEVFLMRITNFEEELRKSPHSIPNTASLAAEFTSFKAFVVQALSSLQQQVELLAHTVDQLEVRSRRKMLLFQGIPENSKENTALTP